MPVQQEYLPQVKMLDQCTQSDDPAENKLGNSVIDVVKMSVASYSVQLRMENFMSGESFSPGVSMTRTINSHVP